jgi:hypothetical protein
VNEKAKRTRKLTIADFLSTKEAPELERVLDKLNGGTFMDCHTAVYEATGLWIPELVPVFQRLDAALAFKELPAEVR